MEPELAAGDRPSLVEALGVWLLLVLVGTAVAVTYARVAPAELFNVDEVGLAGGLGRALVFLNFPTGLVAIPIAALAADRLASTRGDAAALAALLLCLVVALPGVVEEDDLDAKPLNAVPAAGALLALVLTFAAVRRRGAGPPRRWYPGDWARAALAAVLVAGALPWWLAELGLYASDVPGLGALFLAGEVVPEPGRPALRAVHLGHHHGLDGVLFALSALALSRELARVHRRRLRTALGAYLSLLLVYGLANAVQDFWLEQVVKRGTTSARLPEMLRPELGWEWAGILLAAAAVYAVLARAPHARARLLA